MAARPGAAAAGRCLHQGATVTAMPDDRAARSLLCLTNALRIHNGAKPLRLDTRLYAAAVGHSTDMIQRGYFGHVGPDGNDPSDRAAAAGYPGLAAENLAADSTSTARRLFEDLRNSPEHAAVMLDRSYRAAGFGVDGRAALGGPGGMSGITGTEMFGKARADTGLTGLELYASSKRCAKAKRHQNYRRIKRICKKPR
jgi:hypothetical protein